MKASCEPDCLSTLRFHQQGAKKVIMARVEDLITYMTDVKKIDSSAVTALRASIWFKVADKQTLEDFAHRCPIKHMFTTNST